MKVIVAEDDPLFQRLLADTLQLWGHTVHFANDGLRAWELIASCEEPCIALLDWIMPGMDGPTLCSKLSTLPNQPLIYAVLLTCRTKKEDIIAGLKAGANDYITKPFDRDELFARLQVGVRVLNLQQCLMRQVRDLADALANVKQLQGLLPICSYCKDVRTDDNYWQRVEKYLHQHTELQFSHGICPSCYEKIVEPELQSLKAAP